MSTNPLYPIDPSLGKKIRALRVKRGLTQKELQDRSGVSWATIMRFENGIRCPTMGNFQALLTALHAHMEIVEERTW